MKDWDGLLGWFLDQADADRSVLDDPYLRQWFAAVGHETRAAMTS
jgi:hypothetical protein